MNPPRVMTGDDAALAMELIGAGVQKQHIAAGMGVDAKTLRRTLSYAELHGYWRQQEPVLRATRTRQVQDRAAQRLGVYE